MEMSGEQLIPASQAATWAALNDPEILKACVPGCESIEKTAENEYVVLMTARIGPVSAKFKGKLALSDLDPPNSYSLAFQLLPEGGNTKLTYQVKANVGGKLAQIGSRLVDAAAKKLSEEFFNAFTAKVASENPGHGDAQGEAHHEDEHHEEHHPEPVADDPDKPKVDNATLMWIAGGSLVVFVVALFALF